MHPPPPEEPTCPPPPSLRRSLQHPKQTSGRPSRLWAAPPTRKPHLPSMQRTGPQPPGLEASEPMEPQPAIFGVFFSSSLSSQVALPEAGRRVWDRAVNVNGPWACRAKLLGCKPCARVGTRLLRAVLGGIGAGSMHRKQRWLVSCRLGAFCVYRKAG